MMKNRPEQPRSAERDDATREALTELLQSIGWNATGDAQHSRITAALPKLRALLAPSVLPGGGPAFPVDAPLAHSIAAAATLDIPAGPERELAYIQAQMRAMAGMELRDKFAESAMAGMLSNSEDGHHGAEPTIAAFFRDRRRVRQYAELAYDIADAMLAEREARHG